MEAAGVPRLDVERLSKGWSAAQRGVLVSVGHRGGTRVGCSSLPMPLRWPRNEACGVLLPRGTRPNCALGTLAY